jgi:hypothetical protein
MVPDGGWFTLPEDSGTLGALNRQEKALQAKWNDFLDELEEDQDVATLTEAEIHIGAIYIPPQPPAPLGTWGHRDTEAEIVRRMGRSLTTYSRYDQKIINRVLLGTPEVPWFQWIIHSHPIIFTPSPMLWNPDYYTRHLESFRDSPYSYSPP